MAFGTMSVDYEVRVDYDRLRRERLARASAQLERSGCGAFLCFDTNNVRYITSTYIGEWSRDKMERYCLLPCGGDPTLFELGSAAKVRQMFSPWLKGRIEQSESWSRSTVPTEFGQVKKVAQQVKRLLGEYGVEKEPLGVDILDVPLLKALEAEGIEIADGMEQLLEARLIKTADEIALLKISASMVDATYRHIVEQLKPGLRESDVVAIAHDCLYRMGSDLVECVNVVSGERTNPHPHLFTDRTIRPGDMVFIDIMQCFNGYRTCYYRTFNVGRPSKVQRQIYDQAWSWLKRAIEAVRPGITTADICQLWPTAQEIGLRDEREAYFLQFGHGIGLSHRERPMISRLYSLDHPVTIQKDMVLALETYCGSPDRKHGARIEEEVVVTEDGCEVITGYPCEELVCTWLPGVG
ncbi:MAG TPA: Xaa-Pro peptidase family protein [Chloroflexota bacterium]|jgi:Xaa-Pro dipeptidase